MTEVRSFRIVFFGTPSFAVPSLQALLDGPDVVVGVVCQPDRPAGRGQHLHVPPVKGLASSRGIPVAQPEKLRSGESPLQLRAWKPDLCVVAAYGRILPPAILELPPLGCINVHASLLPKYRGAAPIQWAILRAEAVTGITIMQMNERMDEGDIRLQRQTPIGSDETFGELEERLAHLGAAALTEALVLLRAGELPRARQDDAQATLARMISKEDGRIDWHLPAVEIVRRVRAFNPWPSAFTFLEGKLLKIHRARMVAGAADDSAGVVVRVGDKIEIGTGRDRLAVEELQLAGRKRLAAAEFARGGLVVAGTRLG